jgi:hypothetical protein
MEELAAARAKVEAAVAVDAARAAAAELEALRASSTDSSVSVDETGGAPPGAPWRRSEQPRTPRGTVAAAQTGADAPTMLWVGARVAAVPPTAAAAQTGADAPVAGSMEIAAFTGGVALPPRTGTMVTMGSMPLSGTSVPVVDDLPSPRSTTLSGLR